MSVSPRELFCAVVSSGPLLRADAIIVLCGEDATPRVAVGAGLLQSSGAQLVVLTGGKHDPPRWRGATDCAGDLMGLGVRPAYIHTEDHALSTRDQAVTVVRVARERKWKRVLLVASPYHSPRAMLTFIAALTEQAREALHVLNCPASHCPWFGSPDGMTETRVELYERELAKIEEYQAKGHVASYEDGLAYLKHWEGK